MTSKIEKALKKLTEKERREVKNILVKIERGIFKSVEMKKLKGHSNIFRVRKGNLRIIFQKTKESTSLLSIERRTDKTYKGL